MLHLHTNHKPNNFYHTTHSNQLTIKPYLPHNPQSQHSNQEAKLLKPHNLHHIQPIHLTPHLPFSIHNLITLSIHSHNNLHPPLYPATPNQSNHEQS